MKDLFKTDITNECKGFHDTADTKFYRYYIKRTDKKYDPDLETGCISWGSPYLTLSDSDSEHIMRDIIKAKNPNLNVSMTDKYASLLGISKEHAYNQVAEYVICVFKLYDTAIDYLSVKTGYHYDKYYKLSKRLDDRFVQEHIIIDRIMDLSLTQPVIALEMRNNYLSQFKRAIRICKSYGMNIMNSPLKSDFNDVLKRYKSVISPDDIRLSQEFTETEPPRKVESDSGDIDVNSVNDSSKTKEEIDQRQIKNDLAELESIDVGGEDEVNKLRYLIELGVLDFLKARYHPLNGKCPNSRLAKIISTITGGNSNSIASNLGAIGKNSRNNPYPFDHHDMLDAKEQIQNKIRKIGFRPNKDIQDNIDDSLPTN